MATVDSLLVDSERLNWLDKASKQGISLASTASPSGWVWVISTHGQIVTNRASLRDAIDDARKVLHWL